MATDVAARGLDIDNIDVIVQYSVRNVDAFVHRAGRTGRAGKDGLNIVFAERENIDFLKQVENSLNINFNYINSISNFNNSSETENIEKDNKEELKYKNALTREVEKLQKSLLIKRPVNPDVNAHVNNLCT